MDEKVLTHNESKPFVQSLMFRTPSFDLKTKKLPNIGQWRIIQRTLRWTEKEKKFIRKLCSRGGDDDDDNNDDNDDDNEDDNNNDYDVDDVNNGNTSNETMSAMLTTATPAMSRCRQ